MKIRRFLAVLAVLVISAGVFTACGSMPILRRHSLSDAAIETQLEIQIRRDYIEKNNTPGITFAQTYIMSYYGTFSESSVVRLATQGVDYPAIAWQEEVGGIVFAMGHPTVQVYRNGEFYTLSEAYERGYLTAENLTIIANKHQGNSNGNNNQNNPDPPKKPAVPARFYSLQEAYDLNLLTFSDVSEISYHHNGNWDGMPTAEFREPLPKNPTFLSAEAENKIKQTFLDEFNANSDMAMFYTIEDVTIQNYCGTYNGSVVVFLQSWQLHTMSHRSETVAGIRFAYNDGNGLRVWTEQQALTQGTYITDDGHSYVTLRGDSKFVLTRSIATSWAPSGKYIISDGYLVLYVGEDSEPFASFKIENDRTLIFLSGHEASMIPVGTVYKFIEDDEFLHPITQRTIQNSYITTYIDKALGVTPDEIGLTCYGVFGNSMVVFIRFGGSDSVVVHETVAGFIFHYPGESYNISDKLSVWNAGKFYTLTDAYEQGLLTKHNIAEIWGIVAV